MLLTLDTNRNARIEKDEVPQGLKAGVRDAARAAGQQQQRHTGTPGAEPRRTGDVGVAGRYVDRLGIDVDAELAKLKKSEGEAFNRFEQQPMPLGDIRDPKQARQLFAQFDENADGKLDPKEVPDPLQEPIERLVRIADRDGDGKLTRTSLSPQPSGFPDFSNAGRTMEQTAEARRQGRTQGKVERADSGEELAIRTLSCRVAALAGASACCKGWPLQLASQSRLACQPSLAPRALLPRRANRELRQHVLRNRYKPTGCRAPQIPAACLCRSRFGSTERSRRCTPCRLPIIHSLPVLDCPWLPPICFGVKPYLELCRTFDESLKELEARYPSHRPVLTLEARQKRFKQKCRPK